MWKDLLNLGAVIIDSVDSDADILVGGLQAAQSDYNDVHKILKCITAILLLICIIVISIKVILF